MRKVKQFWVTDSTSETWKSFPVIFRWERGRVRPWDNEDRHNFPKDLSSQILMNCQVMVSPDHDQTIMNANEVEMVMAMMGELQ